VVAIDAPIETAPLRFDAGRVVGISLGVFRRQWRSIVLLSLVVWAIAVAQNLTGFAQYRHGSHDLRHFAAYCGFALGFVAIGWLRDAATVSASLEAPGERRPFVRAISDSLRVFGPLLAYRLVSSGPALLWTGWAAWALSGGVAHVVELELAVGAALWLYGLACIALFGLIIPVAVVEQSGLVSMLRRSAVLLAPGRWRFLGLAVFTDVVGALPATLGGGLVAFTATQVAARGVSQSAYFRIEGVVAALLASLVTALWLTIVAVSYREFRRLREGAPHDQLATIFA
jgi:hypothetical protein